MLAQTDLKFTNLTEISEQLHNEGLQLDPVTYAAANLITLCNSLMPVYPGTLASKPMRKYLEDTKKALIDQIQELGNSHDNLGIQELPRVSPELFNKKELAEFLKAPVPVVFEGAAAQTEAVKTWSPEFFLDNYGDFPCTLATADQKDIPGKIADVLIDIVEKRPARMYIHNLANILNENPILEEQLNLSSFLSELGSGRHLGSVLFMGGSGTGSNFHAADGLNVFFNVYGEKEWFFVHPKYTFLMEGYFNKTGSYAFSPVDHNTSPLEQIEDAPLYKFVPIYRTRLKPGDILLNTPWWWHAVNNYGHATIACAVRWYSPFSQASLPSPVLTAAQGMVPDTQEVANVLKRRGARFTDELYRKRFDSRVSRKITQ